MYVTTQFKHQAIAQASAQLFKPSYEADYAAQYPNYIDFLTANVYFVTLTLHQNKVSMHDRLGLSTARCPYQSIIDERSGGYVALNSKNISELQHIAKKHQIQDYDKLHKIDL